MELKKIAILGPRGNVGKAIISELIKRDPNIAITSVSRSSSTIETTPNETTHVTYKTADFSSLSSLTEAFAGQDAVVNCVTGCATHYDPSKLIIDAALTAGVKFFFANEFVGDITSEQFRRLPESFVGSKIRIRELLQSLSNEGRIQWTALNGGPFFDMWLMKGPAGFDIPNKQVRIYGTGDNPLCWTPLGTIASTAVTMLLNPTLCLNRSMYIRPIPNLTQNTIRAAVEEVLSIELTAEHVDVTKINRNARIALERGEIGKAMRGLTVSNQFYEEDSGYHVDRLVDNETLGVETITVEEAVRDAVEKWGTTGPVVESMFKVEACQICTGQRFAK